MINNYGLFYSYKNIGDVLFVLIDNEKKATRHERKGNVEVIYNNDDIIGYNIFNISEVIKLKTKGKIFLPSPILIKVINTILKNAGVEELNDIKESGYNVGKVISIENIDKDKYLITVDLKDEMVKTIIKDRSLMVNDFVVVAKVGTMLNNGKVVKNNDFNGVLLNGHICNENELQISDNEQTLIIKEECPVGEDFFVEEK